MKFTGPTHRQSRMVAGVCVADGDYDALLRAAIRIALGIDTDPARDDFRERYDRILTLMRAYIHSPEGQGCPADMLMARLAVCIIDVIPLAQRLDWLNRNPVRP
jgi:hypothetical protein